MIESAYPLSPLQQGMLFHALYAPGSGVDVQQIVCSLQHPLDIPALERAWARLIQRHAVLRTSLKWEGLTEPQQEVHSAVECPLILTDWQAFGPEEQQARLNSFLDEDRRRGFDLSRTPLMRLALFRRGSAAYELVWTFHHILIDGRSQVILLQELWSLYEAFEQGQDLELALPRPYRDYIDWVQQQDWTGAESFWRNLLAHFKAPTPLPMEQGQSAILQGGESHAYRERVLSAGLIHALRTVARQQGLSLHILVQGAWALLLSRYSGQEDVVLGATRACRRSALGGIGTESMVGLFINTLPVRVRVAPRLPLGSWLAELRAQWVATRAYEHTPLSKVQEWSDLPHGTPLFQSIEVFENFHLNSLLQAQGGDWYKRTVTYIGQNNYPLTLLGNDAASLQLAFQYYSPQFDQVGIDRILGHVETALEGMVENPNKRLADLEILAEDERRRLVVEWNNTRVAYPADRCLHELLAMQALRTPDAIAVRYQEQTLTYAELDAQANALARRLARLGVGPETIVGLCLERSPELVIGLVAILKAGGAFLPLDPGYPDARLAFMLDRSGTTVVLTQQRLAARLSPTGRTLICLDSTIDLPAESNESLNSRAHPQSLAYVIFTSGSTGEPKGVMVPHLGLVNYLLWAVDHYAIAEGRGAPVHSPIGFDLTITSLLAPLLAGVTVTLLPEGEGLTALSSALGRERDFSLVKLTPSHLELLRHQLAPAGATGRARALIIGGEALTGDMLRFWQENAPATRLINEYGPTETVVGCSVYEAPAGVEHTAMVPIGRPIANTQLYILDQALKPVPISVLGELYVGGDGVARGYIGRPDLTAERFIPDPFAARPGARLYRTGDVARYLRDGNIEFLGRVDTQVKLRGYRIELGEVEAVLQSHPAIRQVAVTMHGEEAGGGHLVAYLASETGRKIGTDELVAFLQARLPAYMIPAAWVWLPELPLSANGKVDRGALPAPDFTRPRTSYTPPGNEIEQVLAGIWAQVLRLEKVSVDDDFFALGGHSLLATQLVSRVRQTFMAEVPLRMIFDAPTIAAFGRMLVERESVSGRTAAMASLRLKAASLSAADRQKQVVIVTNDN